MGLGREREMARVLLVEDSPDVSRSVARLLRAVGHRVDIAETGEAALASLAAATGVTPLPDLIVMDLILPGIGGEELLGRVRADARTRDIPVVFLSGHCDEPTRAPDRRRGPRVLRQVGLQRRRVRRDDRAPVGGRE